jgi:hypothetical protein
MNSTNDNKPTKPRTGGYAGLTVGLIKEIFTAAAYEFIEESPKGRLLFYDYNDESEVQFWYKNAELSDVINLIVDRAAERGIEWGQSQVRQEIKNALGL